MVFYYSTCQDFPDTGRSTGEYIVFYQGVPTDHCTHIPVPVAQFSSESYYTTVCTEEMYLLHFIMINNELVNKYPDVVPDHSPLLILDIKSAVCISNNRKYTKHTIHIFRIIHFVRNGEECNLHKTVRCEVFLQLEDIVTKNIR